MKAPNQSQRTLDSHEANSGTRAQPEDTIDASTGRIEPARDDRIRRAAYAAAERRGFAPGFELDDWLEAERQLAGESAQATGGQPAPGQPSPADGESDRD